MGYKLMDSNEQPNGQISRLRAYLTLIKDVWSTFGLPTIILAILYLTWIGYIDSPLGDAKSTMEAMKESIDRHVEQDHEIIFYMKGLCISNAKLAQTPIDDCLWRSGGR